MTMDDWANPFLNGWVAARKGEYDSARELYRKAAEISAGVINMPEDLCLARHMVIKNTYGYIRSPPPTEDSILGIEFRSRLKESVNKDGMKLAEIPDMEANIRKYTFDPGYHLENITKELPHIFVLSTGRCGTVSWYHLFKKYLPYHSYLMSASFVENMEMMCRHIEGDYDTVVDMHYAITRSAEWLSAINLNVPMVALNHLDTIFAPTFAQIHPLSKFIYLHRDPEKIFESFYSKNQWSDTQLQQVYYDFPFKWKKVDQTKIKSIAWYIKFTEEFSRAFGRVNKRFIEISADKLFQQDKEEIQRLEDFTGVTVGDHFKTVYNEKAHKKTIEFDIADFRRCYESL